MTYRVGNHQPQNVYRGEQYIGVMFTAEDAELVVAALNGAAEGFGRWCEQETNEKCSGLEALEQTPSPDLPRETECDCGHDGLDPMFHLRPCPVAELRASVRKLGYRLELLAGEPVDSCTCPTRPMGGLDPACPVHEGRRARGPKPPPVGEGCICDGSGRTCPRHGAVK